jgi:hypothetical protein
MLRLNKAAIADSPFALLLACEASEIKVAKIHQCTYEHHLQWALARSKTHFACPSPLNLSFARASLPHLFVDGVAFYGQPTCGGNLGQEIVKNFTMARMERA